MKRYILLIAAIGFAIMPGSVAAQDFFRQFERNATQALQREIQRGARESGVLGYSKPPQQGGTKRYDSRSVPSEGGNKSGGQGFRHRDGFFLPGNGGQPGYIQPQPQPRPQPRPGWNPNPYPGGLPIHGQPIQGQPIYGSQPGGQPIYGPPQIGSTTQYGSPSASIPTAPVSTSQFVTIRCPATATGSIYYRLESGGSNYGFTMRPGQEQRFRVSADWVISYSDGSRQQRYRLSGGKTYTLKRDAGRWRLYSVRAAGS